MTELDFDELDKAVNSLMGDVDTSKRNPALDDPEDTVVTLAMSDSPADPASPLAPVTPAPVSDASTSTVATPTPVAPLAVKRRGQFMDVIHPSSDMKSPFAPVNRQGPTLQPSSPVVVPEVPVAVTEPEPPTDAVASLGMEMESTGTGTPPAPVQSAPPEAAPEEPVKNEWPDPIDMAQPTGTSEQETPAFTDEPSEPTEPDEATFEPQPTDNQPIVEDSVLAEAEPLSSPFIADAKVEKRPLGMPVAEEPQAEPAESTAEGPVEDTSQNDTPPVLLPEELKSDVMSLESSNTGAAAPAAPEVAPAPPVDNSSSATTGSIQQQYTEQPNTGDQTNTPIFDTSTHVQPLEAAKKKSPIKWIFAILFLLIVGVAAGVAYFYYTTQ